MSDLRTLLHEAAGPEGHTAAGSVAADLARARLALRRRRLTRVGGATALVAAVALGASAVLDPALLGRTSPPTVIATGDAVRLVAYSGEQAAGFILDEVPAGWRVERLDNDVLALVPESARVPDRSRSSSAWPRPNAGPRPATTSPSARPKALKRLKHLQGLRRQKTITSDEQRQLNELEQRYGSAETRIGAVPELLSSSPDHVVVALAEADWVLQKKGRPVTVNGRDGVLLPTLGANGEPDGGRTLYLKQSGTVYLTIQVTSGLGWTVTDTLRLASGIHVTKNASVGAG